MDQQVTESRQVERSSGRRIQREGEEARNQPYSVDPKRLDLVINKMKASTGWKSVYVIVAIMCND